MNSKALSIIVLAFVLGGGFYLLGSYTKASPLQDVGSARLMMDGTALKILTSKTNIYGRIFLFQDRDGQIINTLSVENTWFEEPTYRIVKGHTHDWLVVTTMYQEGTGILQREDNWYVVSGYSGGTQSVLAYLSNGNETSGSGDVSKEFSTEVINDAYTDDRALDVRYTVDYCEPKAGCTTTSKRLHYVWQTDASGDKESFALDLKKSDVPAKDLQSLWSISDLGTYKSPTPLAK